MQKATASLFRKQPTSLRLLRRKRKAGFNFRFYPILYSIMKLLAIFLILACGSNLGSAAERDAAISENELVRRTQELYDAVVPGDQAPWKKYFADDSIFADEKGRTMDKAKLIADITPLPTGYSGAIKLDHVQSRIYDNVAILSYDANETETIFGQNLSARYHITDTWLRRDASWQIVASQAHRYYEDPAGGQTDPKKPPDLIRVFQLCPRPTPTGITRSGQLVRRTQG